MATAGRDTTCPDFWTTDNARRGDFSWGGVDPEKLAVFVARAVHSTGLKPRKGEDHLKVLVAGAGRSRDACSLRDAMKLPATAVVAADFDADSVHFQTIAGVTGVHQDLIAVVREDWVAAFDVVVDASFGDVFMSDWKEDDIRTGVVRYSSPLLKHALRNLFLYLRPGGVFIVKSIIASPSEYDTVWRVALCGASGRAAEAAVRRSRVADADAPPARPYEDHLVDLLDAAELRRMAMQQPGKHLERSAYTGRLRTSQAAIAATGHVGVWLDRGPRTALQARLDDGSLSVEHVLRARTLYAREME